MVCAFRLASLRCGLLVLLMMAVDLRSVARAEEEAVAQLERELDNYADTARRERIELAVIGAAISAVALPTGIALQQRHQQLKRLTGVGLTVAGAVALVPVVGQLFPSDMEKLRARYRAQRAAGLRGDVLLRDIEQEWQKTAQHETKARHISGGVHFALGAALLPVGITLLLRSHVGSWSELRQLNVGSSLFGIGIGWVGYGASLWITKGDAQRAWDQHLATRPRTGLASTQVGFAPLAHGGALSAYGRF